jgi:hypothetical protein
MKQIQLKTVELSYQGKVKPFDYKQELQIVFQTPMDPQRGSDYNEQRKAMRILDALDKSTDVLELEDADFEYLKARVPLARFGINDPVIVRFVDDVTNG